MSNGFRNNSRRYCSYKGCYSDRLTTNDGAITFFSFPVKDTERCSVWITNSGREEFRYLTPRELGEKKICELHFASGMFSNELKTNLRRSAIPLNWKNLIPELIEIVDDDDEDDAEDDNELAEEINMFEEVNVLPFNSNVNGTVSIKSLNNVDENKGKQEMVTNNSLSSNGDYNNMNIDAESQKTTADLIVSTEILSGDKSEKTSYSNNENRPTEPLVKTANEKSVNMKSNKTKPIIGPASKKTKFHNLPPHTTQTEFYYQQCPSLEETNNSFPEPPDGEMPLFVQQNSVVSLADDAANSEASEPPSKRPKFDKDNDDLAEQMRNAMKHLKNITALLTTSEDEFELFGKSVAVQLKKMSICTALNVQAKIQHLLSQHRIQEIQKNPLSKSEDSIKDVEKNGKTEKADDQEEVVEDGDRNIDTSDSPQLSLDCASETSENEAT